MKRQLPHIPDIALVDSEPKSNSCDNLHKGGQSADLFCRRYRYLAYNIDTTFFRATLRPLSQGLIKSVWPVRSRNLAHQGTE